MTFLPSLIPSRFRGSVRPWSDFEEFFTEMLPAFKSEAVGKGQFAIDVEELNDRYVIEAELPGVDKKNLEVTLQDRLLTIKVDESGQSEKKERNFVRKERWEGMASRSVMLPMAANSDGVEANLKDGILKVSVKKQPENGTKKIAIQ